MSNFRDMSLRVHASILLTLEQLEELPIILTPPKPGWGHTVNGVTLPTRYTTEYRGLYAIYIYEINQQRDVIHLVEIQ